MKLLQLKNTSKATKDIALEVLNFTQEKLKSSVFHFYLNHKRWYGKNGIKRPIYGWVSGRERNAGLSFQNFSWQSEKISSPKNCLYGIIAIKITPLLDGGYSFSATLLYHIR